MNEIIYGKNHPFTRIRFRRGKSSKCSKCYGTGWWKGKICPKCQGFG